jgi:hypothetical protein
VQTPFLAFFAFVVKQGAKKVKGKRGRVKSTLTGFKTLLGLKIPSFCHNFPLFPLFVAHFVINQPAKVANFIYKNPCTIKKIPRTLQP